MELITQNASSSPLLSVGGTASVPNPPEIEAPSTQPVVGIIYPPPEVRNIVDKTASFVARNGPEFESRIEQNETGNPKFNFLNPSDPYHAYYQQKVKEFQNGKVQEIRSHNKIVLTPSQQQKQQEILKQVVEPFVPKGVPPEFEFVADPPSISALDLDIVKLTAQFVSRNGRQFLTNLMNREQRSYQFDFLRPQHSLFQYFTRLLEQYTKVLIPPKELMWKLKEESDSMKNILDMVKYRAEWIKYQEAQQRKEEEELEKERVAYAQIDWHDFVVVETVDYQPFDHGNFPPPTTPDEVGARVLMQERIEDGKEMLMQIENEINQAAEGCEVDRETTKVNDENQIPKEVADDNQVQDMDEVSSDDETSSNISAAQTSKKIQGIVPTCPQISGFAGSKEYMAQTTQPLLDNVIIKKGYDPKLALKTTRLPATDEVLISPITGEKIPASKVQEHMRIGLLDPRWVEQRDKHIQDKLNQETVYAPGSAIEASLKQLAERRTDIFGVGEETAIGKKIGEEDKQRDGKVTWDGHTSSVEAATRAARANITLEEQIYQIHKVKGLLPDEEKEKIGPKPAGARNILSVLPILSSSSNQSAPPHSSGASNPPIPGVSKQATAVLHQNPLVLNSISKQITTPVSVQSSQPQFSPQSLTIPPMPPPPTILAPQPNMMMMSVHQHMIASTSYSVTTSASPMQAFMQQLTPQMQHAPPQTVQLAVKHSVDTMSSTDEEPPSKKALRTEESLIPEETFLSTYNRGTVCLNISVPYILDKPEWKLRGQVLSLTLPLTDTVAVVKAKIHDETGMPPGKQKLQCEGLFFKDSNSLAYYNIVPGTMIYLQLKERGGRKK